MVALKIKCDYNSNSYNLLSFYYLPWHCYKSLYQLIFTISLRGGYYYYSHFIEKAFEACLKKPEQYYSANKDPVRNRPCWEAHFQGSVHCPPGLGGTQAAEKRQNTTWRRKHYPLQENYDTAAQAWRFPPLHLRFIPQWKSPFEDACPCCFQLPFLDNFWVHLKPEPKLTPKIRKLLNLEARHYTLNFEGA